MCNFDHRRNTYKANVLLLLLSSLVTQNYLQYSIDITTEQALGISNSLMLKSILSKCVIMLAFNRLSHLLTKQALYYCINIIVVQVSTIYGHDNITPLVKEQDLMYWVGTIQTTDPCNP